MIERQEYLNKLIRFKDKNLIKVITGIRRCGKSTLFELYKKYLMENGVLSNQIILLNLESGEYYNIKEYNQLYGYVNRLLNNDTKNYVFLDEVQNVNQFQKAVDALYVKKNVDLHITGSNAYLLSGELATLLSGRYVEIKMLPLSFKEFVIAKGGLVELQDKYSQYLTHSSFPGTLELDNQGDINMYLEGIYSSVVLKDVISRKKIQDVSVLEAIIRFMFDNIGNLCSSRKIAGYLTSQGRKISVTTVQNYLQALVDSFILHRAKRYDLKGKEYLESGFKYYLTDIGLRYYLLGTQKADMGHILENIVYLELIRRGNDVYIGKMNSYEIDFVAYNNENVEYYQVALSVLDEKTLERELKSINSIQDHNPKYLLTMDYTPLTSHNGIKQLNVLKWLVDDKES